ncbi:MAPEG family protein [Coralloluteibacterium thermophilus]|uniref:MAPEG family protein n=1 Tax=Coralloluteibacterium thermophilum TaxID=2707049 RepID=A0ABV9NFE3_9GAMM
MFPTLTLLFASLHALLLLALSLRVSLRRRSAGIGLGSGGDDALARRIRAQANFVEYVPLALLLIGLLELSGLARAWLVLLGSLLLAGRLLHAWGLERSAGVSAGRALGMLLTWGVLAGAAAAGLALATLRLTSA